MHKVLITTVPFADKNSHPLDLLEKHNIGHLINPLNKKLTEDDNVKKPNLLAIKLSIIVNKKPKIVQIKNKYIINSATDQF